MKTFTISALAIVIALSSHLALAHGDDWKQEFKKADTNKDGSLSMDEWNAHGKEMFKEIDANKDGKISMDEKEAYIKEKHEQYNENASKSDSKAH